MTENPLSGRIRMKDQRQNTQLKGRVGELQNTRNKDCFSWLGLLGKRRGSLVV